MKSLADKYAYRVEWSEEDGVYIAACLELPTVMAHGATMERALSHARSAVRVAIKSLQADHEEVPEPFSTRRYKGRLLLRTSPEVHRDLSLRAAEQGVSLNQFVLSKVIG